MFGHLAASSGQCQAAVPSSTGGHVYISKCSGLQQSILIQAQTDRTSSVKLNVAPLDVHFHGQTIMGNTPNKLLDLWRQCQLSSAKFLSTVPL